jgi:arsenate reductase
MSKITIYHNPRCSKSRQTLQLLRDEGIEPTIVEYLKDPPDEKTLDSILTSLGIEPIDLIRRKEQPFKDLGLSDKTDDRDALIKAMVAHPVLIERPIVLKGKKAAVGRPPEKVLDIL